ncbi:hypothetical protein QQS21_006728 [Conoideocrella luteorostrata]|uniref:Transcriptional regulator n=1 Tax=Conoideocrella luteorostrata TaxID=1105319 RepID=A0AAJ0CM75_9HYPO|nr:hypothetical protein QQS21_006728 [Conoideocrella luteorostrata]
MVPSPEELEEALIDGTYQVFTTEPDATTVNKVRKHVEDAQGLEEGFFTNDEWKQKSKALIKEYVDKLLDGWVPEPKEIPAKSKKESKNGIKRHASEDDSTSPKRQKQKNGEAGKRGKDTGSEPSEKPQPKKGTPRRKSKEAGVKSEEESHSDEIKSPSGNTEDSGEDALSSIKVDTSKPPVDEEEEYSDVIDEPTKPKRKKKEAKQASSKPPKPAAKKSGTSATDDPQEAEIKKLQSHLVKCGVRKLWHNELRHCGDDVRAKIRHLKKMLADVGMDGRFSEAKAREIKETRELLADAEAAQEMNALWGMDSGRRASRSKHRSMKLDESEGSDVDAGAGDNGNDDNSDGDGGGDDDDDEGGVSFAARRRRAQADLAFLGDDSDSD